MSSNTKQVLAITLGSLGLVIGIFSMITAFNAKNAVDEESSVTEQVKTEFAAAQTRQDALEATQASKAEQLVASLSNSEKSLVKRLNGNQKAIKKLKRRTRNLKKQVNSLNSRVKELDSEVSQLGSKQQDDFQKLSNRINKTNQAVAANTQSINRLRSRVGFDEAVSP